jgi:hypothetical protein
MERLVEIEFTTTYNIDVNVLTKEQLDMLQSICSKPIRAKQLSQLHIDKQRTYDSDGDKDLEESKIMLDKYCIESTYNIVNLNALLSLPFKVKFSIQSTIKEVPEYELQNSVLHKLLQLESKLANFNPETQFNYKVGVHISDLGLLAVKYTTWLEDVCTQELQRYLDDGWRILAVCPQPDKRRPDYVLGRNDKQE